MTTFGKERETGNGHGEGTRFNPDNIVFNYKEKVFFLTDYATDTIKKITMEGMHFHFILFKQRFVI